MFKIYDGKVYCITEEALEDQRSELLQFFLEENGMNKEVKLAIYGNGGGGELIDY